MSEGVHVVMCVRTHSPDPVDPWELLVQVHHEDAEEDHGHGHLTYGHRSVASTPGRSIADDDDKTDKLR